MCGGAGDHMDPSVRIEMVMPWGASADDERIQVNTPLITLPRLCDNSLYPISHGKNFMVQVPVCRILYMVSLCGAISSNHPSIFRALKSFEQLSKQHNTNAFFID